MIEQVLKQDCVGCKACGDICPTGAISYETDEEGFWYPKTDGDKCVRCGLCDKACPALACHYASEESAVTPRTYKVFHKDRDIRYNSTSGALYYGLADAFLREGGYIAGCMWNEDYTGVYHGVSNTRDGLKKIMRTKYFQSDTEGIYRQVRQLLESGEKVLFCGAPCQVSALYGFLQREYENLYSADFICRGINSPLAYRKYIEELEKRYRSRVSEVHFKNKSRGWTNLGTMVTFRNGKKYYASKDTDPWINAFIGLNLYMRYSCENCRYKQLPRVSDITMGDFWGLSFTPEEERLGVSVALVNTPKGGELLGKAADSLFMEEHDFQQALDGNPALVQAVKLNPARKEFFSRVQNEPYSKVVWSIQQSSWLKRSARAALDRARRLRRRILG